MIIRCHDEPSVGSDVSSGCDGDLTDPLCHRRCERWPDPLWTGPDRQPPARRKPIKNQKKRT